MTGRIWLKFLALGFSVVVASLFIHDSVKKLTAPDPGKPGDASVEEFKWQPLMPGSKVRAEMLMEVDAAWELAVPSADPATDEEETK